VEPIAVIGLGCRFPGGADGPEAFWQMLERGEDAVGAIPAMRWPKEAIPGDRPEMRWAGLLARVDSFDAAFFGISPREAESLDPQQRLLLEVSWEALEDAGQKPTSLAGGAVGVFVGAYGLDYQHRILLRGPAHFDAYCATGNMLSTAAGRLSYVLGLQGPAMSVDTACSSSLVSLSLACQSLRARDSDVALAGGVNLILSSLGMEMVAATQALSPDGRCRTFDSRANGFVRGEGCGMLVLKRLSDAQRDGDPIRALIRGWAVNQDGRSTGLTAPNVLSQQALLRRALDQARVPAEAIGYIEMHGTGTPLGDPIEADALREVFGKPRIDDSSCLLGAVKTNLGHLEAAAGVAGVIKAVLALEHEEIPRNLHFRRLNPRISLDGTPLVVPTASTPWRRGPKRRLAGVSGFGISGTNAHVILEEAPLLSANEPPALEASSYLLPLSAKSPAALLALAHSYVKHLSAAGRDARIADITYTASLRRTHHEHRIAVVGQTREELAEALSTLALGEAPLGVAPARLPGQARPKHVFVFSGQGAQWVGMGQRLLAEESVFRATIEACDALLRRHVSWSLVDELRAAEGRSRLDETEIVQPALFAIQVGVAELLRSWGVTPDAVIGHSVGEVAAAHVAGALSLEEAVRLVALRGRIMQKATGLGKMAWVGLPREKAAAVIAGREAILAIAAINDPTSVVLSGETKALEETVAALAARGIDTRALKVNYAFHSPQMAGLARELVAALGSVAAKRTSIPLYSTVTGAKLAGEALDAAYWGKNVREPVQFARAVESAFADGHRLYVEIAPHPVLSTNLVQCVASRADPGHVLFTLRRAKDERLAMLQTLGNLYTHGLDVAFSALHPTGGRCVALPSYPWQRERYWIDLETPSPADSPRSRASRGTHPLLGEAFSPSDRPDTHYWEQWVSVKALPYLDDHRVRGDVVFPGAGYLEMALSAGVEIYGEGGFILEDFTFERMLLLSGNIERRVQLALRDDNGSRAKVEIASRDEETKTWQRHARGTLRDVVADAEGTWEPPRHVQDRCEVVIDAAAHYARMEARQIQYGPAFQGLEQIWLGPGEALGRVQLPEQAGDAAPYQLHPALLDACFQVVATLFGEDTPDVTFVPVEVEQLRLHQRLPRSAWVRAALSRRENDPGSFPVVDVTIMDDDGRALVEITGLRVHAMARDAVADPFAGCAYMVAWRPKDLPTLAASSAPTRPGTWLIFVDEDGTGTAVAALLREQGETCVEVSAGPRFERIGADSYVIEPARQEDYQRLFREAIGADSVCRGVVHFWSLDAAPWESTTAETLMADVRQGSVSTLLLVQELVWQGFREAPRLVLVTRGAQMVTSNAPLSAVSQAPLWGLGRTIAMEQPDLACMRVDLSPWRRQNEASLLVRELFDGDGEDQIALRDEGRLVARLQQGDLETAESPALSSDASYLITGGLGGLGLSLAAWMVSQGARHLVLLSRGEPSEAASEAIRALEATGVEVCTWRGDVSRPADVEGVLAQIRDWMPPLRGIVHAAGVLEDRTLQEMGEDQFWKPIRPKVLGAWNLHAATHELPLNFFVMYSSAAALLGSPGQGNYAAANAFLDALAHRRIALGLPAMSIQWGAFSEVGLAAAQENHGARLSHRGIESFTPEDGTALFARLLARPRAEVGLLRMSVRQWIEFYPSAAAAPFLSELSADEGRPGTAKVAGRFRETLEGLLPWERRAALELHILECLSRVLRLAVERIDAHAPFGGYGIDSLMSLEIRNRLEPSLGLKLSAALLYTHPNASALVDHLLVELQLETEGGPGSVSGFPSDAAPAPQELSEEATAALLNEKLLDLEDYLK
jgi:myxalamid-type polyketide synthase MxaE and MxaD